MSNSAEPHGRNCLRVARAQLGGTTSMGRLVGRPLRWPAESRAGIRIVRARVCHATNWQAALPNSKQCARLLLQPLTRSLTHSLYRLGKPLFSVQLLGRPVQRDHLVGCNLRKKHSQCSHVLLRANSSPLCATFHRADAQSLNGLPEAGRKSSPLRATGASIGRLLHNGRVELSQANRQLD